MEKDGDAGDAVCAYFFPAVLIFSVLHAIFAQVCAFLHNFVVFLHIFANFCAFLHTFLVLIFRAQSCVCAIFQAFSNSASGLS